jgi:hypothetical protein
MTMLQAGALARNVMPTWSSRLAFGVPLPAYFGRTAAGAGFWAGAFPILIRFASS